MTTSNATSDALANSQKSLLDSITPRIGDLINFATDNDTNRFVFREKNSDDCWYPAACSAITSIQPILLTSIGEHGKAIARADAADLVNNLFIEFADEELPKIYQAQNGSGGYNAITAQLLADDAYARTVNKAAALILDNISKYATIRQGDSQAIAQLFATTRGSYSVGAVGQNSTQTNGDAFGDIIGILGSVFK